MKKIITIFLTLCIMLTIFIPSYNTKAKSINDMQKELDKKRAEYNANQQKQEQLNDNIDYSNSEIIASRNAIEQAEKDITATAKKIQDLNAEIENKSNEIDELMRMLQLTDGDIAYLEYIFGASDMTDLIHRSSIVEEITEYNDQQIDEMNKMAEESKKLQKELEQKLAFVGCQISKIKGVFISHIHTDHILGVAVFCNHYNIPVFARSVNWGIDKNSGKHYRVTLEKVKENLRRNLDEEIVLFDEFRLMAHRVKRQTP